jgi:hypothetical protein
MTGLINNVEQILPVISTISIVSGILAIGLLIITVLLWVTQPIKLLPAAPKKESEKESEATAKAKDFVVVSNPDPAIMKKLYDIITLGYVPTSGWIGTNHTENQQKEDFNANADEQCKPSDGERNCYADHDRCNDPQMEGNRPGGGEVP